MLVAVVMAVRVIVRVVMAVVVIVFAVGMIVIVAVVVCVTGRARLTPNRHGPDDDQHQEGDAARQEIGVKLRDEQQRQHPLADVEQNGDGPQRPAQRDGEDLIEEIVVSVAVAVIVAVIVAVVMTVLVIVMIVIVNVIVRVSHDLHSSTRTPRA